MIRFTHPLPRTVLTVSNRDVRTFEARPSGRALHKKSFNDAIDAALPPDVRRGSASPFKSGSQWGCALGPGLAQNLEGFNGEAEPRLTSGGEAATLPTKDSLCKADPI
jgi:hypothetical protein